MAEWVRASTGDRTVDGSSPTLVKTFGTLAIPFTPLCQCLSEETQNPVGPDQFFVGETVGHRDIFLIFC